MIKNLWIAVILVLLIGCSDSEEDEGPLDVPFVERMEYDQEWLGVLKKDSLRILDIGNSYTDDATALLEKVAEACGVDLSTVGLYSAIRNYASFKTWIDCYSDRDVNPYYIKKVCGAIPVIATLGDFQPCQGEAFRELLQQNRWDIIILHPVSTAAPYYDEWFGHDSKGYLNEFLSVIKTLQPQALIGFYVVHSFWSHYSSNREHSSYARWRLIVNSVEKLLKDGLCDIVIPYGTAIQNLRVSSLNNKYDLTRDGTHLELGLARYAAACCYYETIFAPRYGVSMVGQSFRWNGPQTESAYPVVDLVDSVLAVAQNAAALAVADWHHCYNPEVTSVH